MARRLTDTEKFSKSFFRCLPAQYKLLWEYILCDCDCAGIWIVDEDVARIRVGKDVKFNLEEALQLFNQDKLRVLPVDNGKKWFITEFISFQYGHLGSASKVHRGIARRLQMAGLDGMIDYDTGDYIGNNEVATIEPKPDAKAITERMMALFKELCSSLPKPTIVTKDRKTGTVRRLEEFEKWARASQIDADGWKVAEEVMRRAEGSDFLTGKTKNGFRCDYDWIFCSQGNWLKIIEGRYDNTQQPQAIGQVLHSPLSDCEGKLNF